MTVDKAHAEVVAAQERLQQAQHDLENAWQHVDLALAELGWQRFYAAGAGRLYSRVGGSPVPVDQVLASELRSAAA